MYRHVYVSSSRQTLSLLISHQLKPASQQERSSTHSGSHDGAGNDGAISHDATSDVVSDRPAAAAAAGRVGAALLGGGRGAAAAAAIAEAAEAGGGRGGAAAETSGSCAAPAAVSALLAIGAAAAEFVAVGSGLYFGRTC